MMMMKKNLGKKMKYQSYTHTCVCHVKSQTSIFHSFNSLNLAVNLVRETFLFYFLPVTLLNAHIWSVADIHTHT